MHLPLCICVSSEILQDRLFQAADDLFGRRVWLMMRRNVEPVRDTVTRIYEIFRSDTSTEYQA